MPLDTSKQSMRFWMALCSLMGLVLLTLVSMIVGQVAGGTDQTTMLFAGGLISVTAASVQWLFRNGDAPGKEPTG